MNSFVILTVEDIDFMGFDSFAGWTIKCPECLEEFPSEEWEGGIYCEDCYADHAALRCPGCWEAWDLVFCNRYPERNFILKWED